jgi:hypothetical protein
MKKYFMPQLIFLALIFSLNKLVLKMFCQRVTNFKVMSNKNTINIFALKAALH